ncbi:hypothetical protein GCM10010191_01590 [Actinomadura vinacea]|uniref:Uncharacterized protein n=1 Tax=Actinomadura vinacea TaxID=115336 RepID=A0ABN3IAX8_9ACTN
MLLAGTVLLIAAYFGYSPTELWELGRAEAQPFLDAWTNG